MRGLSRGTLGAAAAAGLVLVVLVAVALAGPKPKSNATAIRSPATTSRSASSQPEPSPSASLSATASAAATPKPVATVAPRSTTAPVVTRPPTARPPAPVATGCIASPHRCGFPDATNTGVRAGTALTPWAGGTITAANTVISARDITGQVTIAAPGVVIKNSRIHVSDDSYDVLVRSGNVLIQDSELYGNPDGAGIAFDNWTGIRLNIHNFPDDGVKLGSNVRLQDSYIHDFATSPGAHADGGQMQGGEVNLTVRHNTIMARSVGSGATNAALFIAPDLGPSTNGPVTIDNNLLGGGNFAVYIVDGNNGQYFVRNISLTNNRFVRNSAQYGAADINVAVLRSGNVWDDTGQLFTPGGS
jgi:hypothetical protein